MEDRTVRIKHLTNSMANIAEWCMRLYGVLSELDPEESIGLEFKNLRQTRGNKVVPISIGCPPDLDELCEEFCKGRKPEKPKKPKKPKKDKKGKKKKKDR